MHDIVFDQPYKFIPPVRNNLWPALIHCYLPRFLRTDYGVESIEFRGLERMRASVEAGHGILMAPNHCRMCDPLVLGRLAKAAGTHVFAMGSWHLFMQSRFMTFMIRRMGAFSVYREGLDRQALNTAIDILDEARRPLVIFAEGAVSRHNDVLMPLMDGPSFIARSAAKRRQKRDPAAKVVVHPVAIRYFFRGDVKQAVAPVLDKIEQRLTWTPRAGAGLLERIDGIAEALLALKEIEYLGAARSGNKFDRAQALIERLLTPLEYDINVVEPEESVVARVKRLRSAIVPELVAGQLTKPQQSQRWKQLADCYLAQQLSFYPTDYVTAAENIPEHVLETVERFEEDTTDRLTVHRPFHVVIAVGEAIEVSAERSRQAGADPVMQGVEQQLRSMLAGLSAESKPQDFSVPGPTILSLPSMHRRAAAA